MIRLCVPSYNGMMLLETVSMVDTLIKTFPDIQPHQTLTGASVATNRNILITKSTLKKQEFDFSHVLFVDADVYTAEPCKVFCDLLNANEMIASAVYPFREYSEDTEDFYPCGNFEGALPFVARSPLTKTKKEYCDVGCLGFSLIKKEVFETLEYPYFAEPAIDTGERAFVIGDDIYFFWKAKRAGFRCLVDFSNILSHQSIGGGHHVT
jgi:hypothetical protein